jgi:DNA-binding response OmpR family regulator
MPKIEKKKVLIIEDEQTLIKALEAAVGEENISLAVAVDGESGLELAKVFRPDIILLDIILPKLNGFEVLKQLKKNKATAGIPVLILSNLGDETDIAKGIEGGAVGYLVKANYKIEEVIQKIREILKQKKAQ